MAQENEHSLFFEFSINGPLFQEEDSAHSCFWPSFEEGTFNYSIPTQVGTKAQCVWQQQQHPPTPAANPFYNPPTFCQTPLSTSSDRHASATDESQDQQLFSCLNLDGINNENCPDDAACRQLCVEAEEIVLQGGNGKTRVGRDETTIAKVIFTMFKKYLRESCPIDMRSYFRVIPYARNHRTLMDFEVPYAYAESLDRKRPGSLQAYRQFLLDVKPRILAQAEHTYHNNPARLSTFRQYLSRIYTALFSGLDSRGRMKMLYRTPSKLPGALEKLQQIQLKFN